MTETPTDSRYGLQQSPFRTPIPAIDSPLSPSRSSTCQNCRSFFSTAKDMSPMEKPIKHVHSKAISEVRQNARNGCTVCGFLDGFRKFQPGSQDGELRFSIHELTWSAQDHGYKTGIKCDCSVCVLSQAELSTMGPQGGSSQRNWKNHRGWVIKAQQYDMSISIVRQKGEAALEQL